MNAFVIATLVKASLIVGAAFAVNALLLRRRSAAARHLVWTLAIGAVLLLPFLSVSAPGWALPIRVAALRPTEPTATSLASAAGPNKAEAALPSPNAAPAPDPDYSERLAAPLNAATAPDVSWTSGVLAIYAAGVFVLALRLVFGRWTLRRLVQHSTEVHDPAWRVSLRECEAAMGLAQPVRLLRSLEQSMPMAFGLRTPTILIPAIADTWPEDRRRAVLLHELAHIDRRDCFTQLLAEVTCVAYWIHPAVWLVARRLRVEREIACDDLVLAAGAPARDYATHLLELAYSLGGYRSPALVVSMARRSQVEGRMLAILDAARNRVTPTLRARLVGLVVTAALVLPLATAEAVIVPGSSEAPESALDWAASPTEEAQPKAPPAPRAPRTPPAPPARALPPDYEVVDDQDGKGGEVRLPGTFEVRRSDDADTIHLQLRDRPNSWHGFGIRLADLDGLPPSLLTGEGGVAKFNLRRDAGTLTFEGIVRAGVGAGTFDFTPDPAFPAAMVKRGFGSPTPTEQYQLARGNIGFAYLDELNAQKYERPGLAELVRAADHGVHLDYLKGMGAAGYRLGKIESLVRTRDHGVTPAYIIGLAAEGIKNLPIDELVRARDHGVTAQYIGTMRAFGYSGLPLDELIRARDHGVSADYIRGMAEIGHAQLPLDQLIRTRDHGVTPEFAKALRDAGYPGLSLEELVRARDHGVDARFVRAWRELGYKTDLEELIRIRDHGVRPEFASALRTLGYTSLLLEDLVRLRDHGVTEAFVRDQNAGPRGRLSVDELVRRRNRGM